MRRNLLCLLFAAGTLTASAQEPLRVGLALTGTVPTGSLRSAAGTGLGTGLGCFLQQGLGNGAALRFELNQSLTFPDKSVTFVGRNPNTGLNSTFEETIRFTRRSAMAHYLHPCEGRNQGFYLSAGLGAMELAGGSWNSGTLQIPASPALAAGSAVFSSTGVKLAWSAGVGYRLKRDWDVSARYTAISSRGATLGGLDFAISCLF